MSAGVATTSHGTFARQPDGSMLFTPPPKLPKGWRGHWTAESWDLINEITARRPAPAWPTTITIESDGVEAIVPIERLPDGRLRVCKRVMATAGTPHDGTAAIDEPLAQSDA